MRAFSKDLPMRIEDLLGEVVLPIVTPFDAEGAIDIPVLGRLIEHLLEHRQCDSLFVAGSTGEFYALSTDERIRLFEHVRAVAANGVRLGYDAVAVIVPYYSRPSQEEIYRHLVLVARATVGHR